MGPRIRTAGGWFPRTRGDRPLIIAVPPAYRLVPPHAAGGLYIVYYYRGAKVVQSILDTYPMGFPAAAAQQQVDRVIGALLAMGPEAEAWSDLLLPYPLVMSDLADAGLHDVAGDRCSEFVSALQQQDLRHGAMLEVLAAVAGDEPDVAEYLLRDSDFDTEFATVRQARAIITTARRQGLDSVKLAKLAAAMGHEAEKLGVTPPSTDDTTCEHPAGSGPRRRTPSRRH